ncbi:copper homeostasis protein CutC, partial [Alistipes putredinis]
EAVIRTGCRRVLTSGGRNTAQEGVGTLRALAAQAAGRIEIMAGSGVNPSNARLLAATGVDALHFSARRERESGMRFRNPQVSMGGCAGVPEYTLTDADEAFVRQLLAKLE